MPGTGWQRYYLDATNASMTPELAHLASAKRSHAGLGDGLTFTTKPVSKETEFTGPIGVRLALCLVRSQSCH
ncbi:hypothetical protein [Burkholderia gladioli]|uniref:hypothetical protein n=1 Tax=Burkholderia gladioli TaxID=28095 RepID=UPI001C613551|nr:hypothetical protein [Burkholderia gladioli]MDN7807285.1 hypothetical protein [Burkholderia gladioli]